MPEATENAFVVICTVGRDEDPKAPFVHYVLATRQTFPSRGAAEDYSRTVNPSRWPLVVAGDWKGLRS